MLAALKHSINDSFARSTSFFDSRKCLTGLMAACDG